MSVTLHNGDCLEYMREMPDGCVDAVITDPPYGLKFMGKQWDHGVPGEVFWAEALRVAKPGAYLLAFGGTRTYHRLVCAIEDAGWKIRDTVAWIYSSGFPKSLDVSKAIDKAAGVERERVLVPTKIGNRPDQAGDIALGATGMTDVGEPITDAARQWDGWGTALKPAFEPIVLARKPLIGTVAANVLEYGTGAINIDGCRVGCNSKTKFPTGYPRTKRVAYGQYPDTTGDQNPSSRWPANLIHDGSDEVLAVFPETTEGNGKVGGGNGESTGLFGLGSINQSRYPGTGSAARFFYCAKASKEDRDSGLDGIPTHTAGECTARRDGAAGLNSPRAGAGRTSGSRNSHPTVKPHELMRYLCRLVTPPRGVVLDPFMGSGSTGKAAVAEGFSFIGCDLSAEYVEIARLRIADMELRVEEIEAEAQQQPPLFVLGAPASQQARLFE